MRKQWRILGQMGDIAIVESGRASVFIGGEERDGVIVAGAMLSPKQAREYAIAIQEAADEAEK